jgi:hypothetical protein
MTHHIGRSWPGDTHIEDTCPCPQEPCGLVDMTKASPDCDQHHVGGAHYAKTIRQGHRAERCPGGQPVIDLRGQLGAFEGDAAANRLGVVG